MQDSGYISCLNKVYVSEKIIPLSSYSGKYIVLAKTRGQKRQDLQNIAKHCSHVYFSFFRSMIIYNADAMIPLWLFISIQPTINLQTQARLIYDMLTKKNNAANALQ